jgi:sulfate-transporting ATPase
MEPLRFALLGLGAGAVYMLSGQGLVLVYRGSGIINFAQGAIGMSGAYVFYEMRELRGVSMPLSFAAAVVTSAVVGALVHLLVMRQLRHAPAVARLLGPLAVLAVLLAIGEARYGTTFQRITGILPDFVVRPLHDTPLGVDRLIMFGIGIAVTIGLAAMFRWTRVGLATSAVAENQRTAASLGISPDLIASLNWALAGALATVAVLLTTSVSGSIDVTTAVLLVIPGLAAALVGGFESFAWTAVGATAIGIAESEMARYVSTPGYAKSVPFLVIVIALIVRGRALPLRDEVVQKPPEVGTGRIRPSLVLVCSAVGLAVVWFASASWADAVTSTCIVALIVLSLVVVTGYAGQLSLAQYALAGMGAWIAARLVANYGWPFPVVLLIGVLGAIPLGIAVGMPALRTRGVNLAIATLGLALVLEQLIFTNPARTGGTSGTQVGSPSLFGLSLDTVRHPERYATFVLVCLVVVSLGVANLRRGRSGRRLLAVRGNERAAASLGIGLFGAKLYAFGLSAAIAALGGILLAFRNPNVLFGPYTILNSIRAAMFAVIGGIGYIGGAVLGATLAPGTLVQRVLDTLFGDRPGVAQALAIAGGLGAVLLLIQNPNGLAAYYEHLWKRFTRSKSVEADASVVDDASDDFQQLVRPATLEVTDVTVRFGSVTAVQGVSARVRPGEVVGLIGPNGAGKTTFIDAITGFVRTESGSVNLNGEALTGASATRRARSGVARSFQSLELFETMTVRENIEVAADRRDWLSYLSDLVWPGSPRISGVAAAAVHEFGLVPDLNRRPSELPFGRRRLVAIARAIASGPSVLLLDEPAAGLSRDESDELGRLVRRLAERWGLAVLIVEHDVGLVLGMCDRVMVLDGGRLIAEGPPDQIRDDAAVIDAYLGQPKSANGDRAEAPVLERAGRASAEPLLEAVELTAGYGSLPAVRSLDLRVEAGEIVALLGPNGAGKTTTLLTLAGELAPISGEVRWKGQATRAPLHVRAREGLALITEERSIFKRLTTAANLRLGRGPTAEALRLFPELEALLPRRAGLLSGGEQQILALARALAGRPSLLIVDELSLGLAPLVIDRLFDALREAAARGVGVLLVEQNARRALDVADRVYVLNRGQLVLSGDAADLRDREDEVRASYLAHA